VNTIPVAAVGAFSDTAPLRPMIVMRRPVGPHDVLIDVAYTGICHSDIHTVRGEWGPQVYPLVPGHEIAGAVIAVGSEVSRHQVGDRVGVGCMVGSCKQCENCLRGEEQYCRSGPVWTYGSTDEDGSRTQGGYSAQIVVNEDFVLRIPPSLSLEAAAPLLCAGVTTFSPLRRFAPSPGMRIAVVGLGGLGHLAVKLATAMGHQVTVLSRSGHKRQQARRLGAIDFQMTTEGETFSRLGESFDLIISTVSGNLPVDAYLGLLALDGVLVFVGAASEPTTVDTASLAARRRVVTGSAIGGIRETQEMLDFCGQNGIGADVEIITAAQINEAYEQVVVSEVNFRFVIDIGTIGASADARVGQVATEGKE